MRARPVATVLVSVIVFCAAFSVPTTTSQFVFETLPPTPRIDPLIVWRGESAAPNGPHRCGSHPFDIRLTLPREPVLHFVVTLAHNVIPLGAASDHVLTIRVGSTDGPTVFRQDHDLDSPIFADLSRSIRPYQSRGWVDLFPTIECATDAWSYIPDADWEPYDIEAYNIPPAHGIPHLHAVSVWYENGVARLEDLAKYDLVVLGDITPSMAPAIATLRANGVAVAGYASFGEEFRYPLIPIAGDGKGPGGFDSRYVDVRNDSAGDPHPDGVPDRCPIATSPRFCVDPRSRAWQHVILERIGAMVATGANAVFFDTFYVLQPDLVPGLRATLLAVRRQFPELQIIVNSYQWYSEVGDLINAVMFESYTYLSRAGCPRIEGTDVRARDDQAARANALRGDVGDPSFDVFTLDYVCPYDAGGKFDDAVARAEQWHIVPSFWQMTAINPAIDMEATVSAGVMTISWRVAAADPDPEAMADVGSYEVRRLDRPIKTEADWQAARIVESGTSRGARSILDRAPPPGSVYYALRAYRRGTGARPLTGTTQARAR